MDGFCAVDYLDSSKGSFFVLMDFRDARLLYRDAGSDKDNFTATRELLERLYTANSFGTAHSFGREDNVRSVEVQVVDETEVIDIIWKHIERYKKPVVTIIDSNKVRNLYIKSNSIPSL